MLAILFLTIYFDLFIFIFGKGNIRCNYNKKDTISNEGKVCVPHPINIDLSCCTTQFNDPIKDLEEHLLKLPTTKKPIIPYISTTKSTIINDKFTKSGCFDRIKKCYLYSNLCFNNFYTEIMEKNCRKTCNLC
ncbi:ShKT domain-containing protein [Strongyloides ratti]|uniref:ShKT domain-containing protein n=1 Tax=Strongyloides ratti TaxID=34506 RepID=A0A090L2K7_STRRB|nr:ShKT domain-containing protein [Strongyloides ratti]CEF63942.1 ShKT domain-containing protein [Strongyloides ratti]